MVCHIEEIQKGRIARQQVKAEMMELIKRRRPQKPYQNSIGLDLLQ
jgi:hypothetical protein